MPIGDGVHSTNQATHDYVARGVTVGFFTDATICIGCKACEVACKEWNGVPDDGYHWTGESYDNTGSLGASTWRHVKFVEQFAPDRADGRWLLMSDVCKHCVRAGCLEVCPTGAIIRTEFDTVVIQSDVCNGCRDCIAACPFGVIEVNPVSGTAQKCTLCYDRLQGGLEPACSKACPTDSIVFGTYWGNRRDIQYSGSYSGDYLFRLDPSTLDIEPLGVPLEEHGIPSLATATRACGSCSKAAAILARAASSCEPVRSISRLKVPKRSVSKAEGTTQSRPSASVSNGAITRSLPCIVAITALVPAR